jgi:hypothetical protein
MKIYWTTPLLSELEALPEKEREKILRECRTQSFSFRDKQAWLGVLACGLCAGLGSYIGRNVFGYHMIGAAVGGGIGGFIFGQIKIRADLSRIRAAITEKHEGA